MHAHAGEHKNMHGGKRQRRHHHKQHKSYEEGNIIEANTETGTETNNDTERFNKQRTSHKQRTIQLRQRDTIETDTETNKPNKHTTHIHTQTSKNKHTHTRTCARNQTTSIKGEPHKQHTNYDESSKATQAGMETGAETEIDKNILIEIENQTETYNQISKTESQNLTGSEQEDTNPHRIYKHTTTNKHTNTKISST